MIIQLHELKVQAIIGIYPHEKSRTQLLVLDVVLDYDGEQASKTDDFTYALDYQGVKRDILNFIQSHSFNLLEALCEELINMLMNYNLVRGVHLVISKPQALRFVRTVSLASSRGSLEGKI